MGIPLWFEKNAPYAFKNVSFRHIFNCGKDTFNSGQDALIERVISTFIYVYFPHINVNLVPVMKVEVHRQRRRRMYGVYEENVCSRSKRAREERVLSDYTSLVMRRYTGITLGFRSQGVEQFV